MLLGSAVLCCAVLCCAVQCYVMLFWYSVVSHVLDENAAMCMVRWHAVLYTVEKLAVLPPAATNVLFAHDWAKFTPNTIKAQEPTGIHSIRRRFDCCAVYGCLK